MKRLYLDTSIWLDLFENRNEPGIPKSDWARKLFSKVVRGGNIIIVSDVVIKELVRLGYGSHELDRVFKILGPVVFTVEAFKKEKRKARNLS